MTFYIKKIGGETNYYLSSDWMDIGSIDGINTAKAAFGGFKNLDKTTEEIYFIDKKVIKFDINDITISQKVERSKKLKKVVPKVLKNTNNFFLYKYVEGDLVADLLSPNEIFDSSTKGALKFSIYFSVSIHSLNSDSFFSNL